MKTSGTIYILTGEAAVGEFEQNGAKGCAKKGFNAVEIINYDEHTSPEDFAREILSRVNGEQESIIVSEKDAKIISKQ